MKEKSAYIIMPYAKKYNRFYSMIIKRAVEDLGYTCIREDLTGQNGHVLKNVITHLAESDIVIADLAGLNWNVAYELGIRHALCASGSIMLCDEATKDSGLPFDIQHYGIILYPEDWLEQELDDKIVNMIQQQIRAHEDAVAVDSPVHEVYTDLPTRVLDAINPESDEKEARIRELEDENRRLRDRVEKAGLNARAGDAPSENIRALMHEAIANSIYYSDDAVRQLRSLQNDGKKEEFADFLATVLEKGFLDEQDCRIVFNICRKLGVPMLTRVFLEQAVKLYPDSEELNVFLANELSKSYQTRDKALLIANERIGLTRKNGKYELASKRPSNESLAAFFNVYLQLKYYNEILQIAPLLLEAKPPVETQCLIRRNVIISFTELGRYEEAVSAARELLELDSMPDINHYSAYKAYRADGRLVDAYLELEECIRLDPDDEDYLYYIAGFVCDEQMARSSVNDVPHPIARTERERYAAPYVLYRVSMVPEDYKRAADFLIRNGFQKTCNSMVEALKSGLRGDDFLDAFEDFDFTFVRYCLDPVN